MTAHKTPQEDRGDCFRFLKDFQAHHLLALEKMSLRLSYGPLKWILNAKVQELDCGLRLLPT
jgi:hypothetical protein